MKIMGEVNMITQFMSYEVLFGVIGIIMVLIFIKQISMGLLAIVLNTAWILWVIAVFIMAVPFMIVLDIISMMIMGDKHESQTIALFHDLTNR